MKSSLMFQKSQSEIYSDSDLKKKSKVKFVTQYQSNYLHFCF